MVLCHGPGVVSFQGTGNGEDKGGREAIQSQGVC